MKTTQKLSNYLFISIMILTSTVVFSGSYEVSPMMIEFESEPRSEEKFKFYVKGKKGGKVKLYIAGLQQQKTGHMSFVEFNKTTDTGLASWIE